MEFRRWSAGNRNSRDISKWFRQHFTNRYQANTQVGVCGQISRSGSRQTIIYLAQAGRDGVRGQRGDLAFIWRSYNLCNQPWNNYPIFNFVTVYTLVKQLLFHWARHWTPARTYLVKCKACERRHISGCLCQSNFINRWWPSWLIKNGGYLSRR